MAIQYRSLSAAANGYGTSVVINIPAGVVENDMLIAQFGMDSNTVITPPAGWTAYYNPAHAYNNAVSGFYKAATDSEPASYTFTLAASKNYAARIVAFYSTRGRSIEYADSSLQGTQVQTNSPVINSLTLTAPNGAICGAITVSTSRTASWAPMTELYKTTIGGSGRYSHGGYEHIAASGATGNRTITLSGVAYWTTLGIAIQEISGNIYTYDVIYETAAPDDGSIHTGGITFEDAAQDDGSVHTGSVEMEA